MWRETHEHARKLPAAARVLYLIFCHSIWLNDLVKAVSTSMLDFWIISLFDQCDFYHHHLISSYNMSTSSRRRMERWTINFQSWHGSVKLNFTELEVAFYMYVAGFCLLSMGKPWQKNLALLNTSMKTAAWVPKFTTSCSGKLREKDGEVAFAINKSIL